MSSRAVSLVKEANVVWFMYVCVCVCMWERE